MTERVGSTNGVHVAVHRLSTGRTPLLVSHATGFHGHCYRAMAGELGDAYAVTALDYRGHGDTAHPPDVEVSWDRFTDDAIAVAAQLCAEGDGPLLAVGHSMGGACLLQAAARRPELFSALVVFEPIVPPSGELNPGGGNPLAEGALRRRATFPTFTAAIDNYAAKPPFSAFRADALADYVHHGFRQVPEGVTLKCTPAIESATFLAGSTHRTWSMLDRVAVPAVVLAGRLDGSTPPALAEPIASRLPNATFERFDEWDHFAPMVEPAHFASVVERHLGLLTAR